MHKLLVTIGVLACSAPRAIAQDYAIPWHTIDAGGGASSGGAYTLRGTIGQHDSGVPLVGGGYSLAGGFWAAGAGRSCYGDFNRDGAVNTLDILAFLNAWSAGDGAADCNRDDLVNTLDVLCFLNAWAAGC